MFDDLTRLSATDLIEVYRSRKVSLVDVCEAVLVRIVETQDSLNAFVTVDGEGALAAARSSEARWQAGEPRGLVDGVPTSIKDLLLAKGMPTLRGSLSVDHEQSWSEDSPAAARLREHGAVILGKTTTPEFGHKGVTDSPLSGITRNPWDTDKTPGGSSGGAAAAVAAGMGPLAVGTDGGGSI
ncbi:MAG: amidase family protein, partial [Alphaproteobacteria bacterium]|nr:amidase family protein [Alphaproteobacteria bacterium]